MFFSIIVPVYNRPNEVDELLDSLCKQICKEFEVLIVEDGSDKDCREVVDRYRDRLNISYYYKENSGQGFSRNYGFDRAKGDYFIVFDSDCIIPPHYIESVRDRLETEPADAWGGPDRAHSSFSPVQKAISYAMTSPWTTGGIRGNARQIGRFNPRSFNMGISREVYQTTGGYRITRMGEDLEFSIRIRKSGFNVIRIDDAYVYHKRRTDFRQFFKQLHFFGRARINILKFHPDQLKPLHLLPSLFLITTLLMIPLTLIGSTISILFWVGLGCYLMLLFFHSLWIQRSPRIALLSVTGSMIQLTAYGAGLLQEIICRSGSKEEG